MGGIYSNIMERVYFNAVHPAEVAYMGVWPNTGPNGEELDMVRRTKAGRPMKESYATVEFRGDWKWHKEILGMKKGYNCNDICHMCVASAKAGASQYFC